MTNHHFQHRRRRLAASIGLVTTLAFATTACGSDSGDTAATTPPVTAASTTPASSASTTTAAPATTAADATAPLDSNAADSTAAGATAAGATEPEATDVAFDTAAFCTAEVDLEVIGAGTGDPSQDGAAVARTLLAPAQRAAELAPPELAGDFEAAVTVLQGAIDTGDGSAIESIDLDAIHAYGLANCGWSPIAVEMTSYHFMGIPETMPAGDYDFSVTNGSPEPHVLLIVKKKAGVTDSWEDLLASPDGQGSVETVAAAFAVTGATESAITRLEPGEYLALCPISQGTTMETEGTGPPHFVLGMQQVITVTG
ncbi:MAG: hypothetical protein ABIR32_23460 [Ilumatobacteraceae bacterium]